MKAILNISKIENFDRCQNCYQKEQFSSNTAAVSPYMLKSVGAKYTLVGHSDNRSEGDTDTMLKDKVRYALKNNLKVVLHW